MIYPKPNVGIFWVKPFKNWVLNPQGDENHVQQTTQHQKTEAVSG
jgi:hypothetical protein